MLCPCGNVASQKHHKFHNVRWARRLYGKLMDDPRNLQDACDKCNVSHAGKHLTHWTEYEFCRALGIPPRSKTELARKLRAL